MIRSLIVLLVSFSMARAQETKKENAVPPATATRAEHEVALKKAQTQLEKSRIKAEQAAARYREGKMEGLPVEELKELSLLMRQAQAFLDNAEEAVKLIQYRIKQLPREVAPPPRPVHR